MEVLAGNMQSRPHVLLVEDRSDLAAMYLLAFDIAGFETRIAVTGRTLTIAAKNGPPNGGFTLLASADLTLPLAQWTPILTNSFGATGAMSLSTNVVDPGNPRQFYVLQTQR